LQAFLLIIIISTSSLFFDGGAYLCVRQQRMLAVLAVTHVSQYQLLPLPCVCRGLLEGQEVAIKVVHHNSTTSNKVGDSWTCIL
jgi:hypothetical protein